MTTAEWKINGEHPANYGVKDISRSLRSQTPDELTLRGVVRDVLAEIPFSYGDPVTLTRDGIQYFKGVVTSRPRFGSGTSEGFVCKAEGPWFYLDRIVYQQNWRTVQSSAFTTSTKARCILGQDDDGSSINSGEVIRQILQYAISAGAALQIGTIGVSVPVPPSEVRDITCAEAIRTMLRWSPDAVVYFDYSTSPPTLHIARRAALQPVTIDLLAAPPRRFEISARPDLQLSAVVLKYEITSSLDGRTYNSLYIDKYPPTASGSELNAFCGTLSLAGFEQTNIYQDIRVEPIQAEAVEWWQKKHPWLADPQYTAVRIASVVRAGAQIPVKQTESETGDPVTVFQTENNLPSELIDGAVHDWMQEKAGRELITAKVAYTVTPADGGEIQYIEDQEISVEITATDADTRTYVRTTSYDSGDDIPQGLAQSVYESASLLHYEGFVETKAQECTGALRVGTVLNISSGRSAWATMNAIIQRVDEDLTTGTTTAIFGPPAHLGFGDLVEMQKTTRTRRVASDAASRSTGSVTSGGSSLQTSGEGPRSAPAAGLPKFKRLAVSSGDSSIVIDPLAPQSDILLLTHIELTSNALRFHVRKAKLTGSVLTDIEPESVLDIPSGTCAYAEGYS